MLKDILIIILFIGAAIVGIVLGYLFLEARIKILSNNTPHLSIKNKTVKDKKVRRLK